jgi:hypothetical protein
VGLREHGGNYLILERKSLDSVDDPARSLQLVLCDLLRPSAIMQEVLSEVRASNLAKKGFGQSD